MRKTFEPQLFFGAMRTEDVKIPTDSRDELPPILAGLQWIFVTPEVRDAVFGLLEAELLRENNRLGCPGMSLWEILVLGVVRLGLNADYDRLQHVANNDRMVRQIIGSAAFEMERGYRLSTLKDNVSLLSEDLLEKINAIVVKHGRSCLPKEAEKLEIKVDSYVYETNVHFPSDLSLAQDSARKCIILTTRLAKAHEVTGWRKSKGWLKKIKKLSRECARASRGGGKNKEERVARTAGEYLRQLYALEEKVKGTLDELSTLTLGEFSQAKVDEVHHYHESLIKQIFLLSERLLEGRTIPHGDKLFSIFEQHTEWVNKGKSRPNVELGHRLLIATDQFGIIHDYKIMQGGNEAAEVASLADRLIQKIGLEYIYSLSFDRGFSTIENRELLEMCMIDTLIIQPKKGKRSEADKEREGGKAWRKSANRHSAVESNINSLEHHGLDRCPDKGYQAYARYAGLGVLAYNLHRLGNHLLVTQRDEQARAQAA
jgi:hypothetical protein